MENIEKKPVNVTFDCKTNTVTEVELTVEEIAQLEINKQNLIAKQEEEAIAEQAKKDAQVSGNQKLLDLGLTQAEATALTGYTPPVAE